MRWLVQFALLCFGLLASPGARAAEPSGFALETGSPDALCPDLQVTRELVARRLGALVVEGHTGWKARYTIGHAPSGSPRDFIRLELFSPEGRVELLRDLPIEGASCRTMAEVIALVLDRYFRGLGESEPRPAEFEAVTAHPRAARTAPGPPPRPRGQSLALARRLSAEYGFTQPASRAWLGLRGSTALGSGFEAALGLRFALTPLQERLPGAASVEARALASRIGVAWRLALPPGLLHLGPILSVAGERATTRGLANRTDRLRILWSAGAEAGFIAPLGRSLFCSASIFADFLAGSGHFFVGDEEVLSPRRLTLGGSIGFGYAWPQ